MISGTECSQCPIGKYSDELGIINENDYGRCLEGRIGLVEGAESNHSCIKCDRGKYKMKILVWNVTRVKYLVKKHQNIECPKGKLSDLYGIECINCE